MQDDDSILPIVNNKIHQFHIIKEKTCNFKRSYIIELKIKPVLKVTQSFVLFPDGSITGHSFAASRFVRYQNQLWNSFRGLTSAGPDHISAADTRLGGHTLNLSGDSQTVITGPSPSDGNRTWA